MRWIIIIGGGLCLLVGVVAWIGSRLPVKHHATRKARFRATPERLYAILAGPPNWRQEVKAYGELPDANGHKTWWEQDGHGKKIRYELMEDRPAARRVVRIADQGLPFGGTWTFEIVPAPEGADLRVHEDGEIYNLAFRFLSRFVFGYYGSIEGFLRNLGAKLGEPVRIEE
jgi:hypothetical protein